MDGNHPYYNRLTELEEQYGVDPSLYGLDDPTLSESEIKLKEKEMMMNAHIDKQLIKYPNKTPKSIFFM